MNSQPVIEVRGLSKRYALGVESSPRQGAKRERTKKGETGQQAKTFWALKDLTFDIHEGQRVGIIGRNGAGKSTLLKILSRVIYPTEGEAIVRGRVTSLLEVGTGFNANATGRENIFINASLHGLSRKEIANRVDDIIAFSEIERFIDTPIKHYSSGMRSRLAFAVAAHLDPDILILDEVLSVGDLAFQQKCLARMNDVTSHGGRTLIFVSHSIGSINQFCNRCLWINEGKLMMDGPVEEVTARYSSQTLGSIAKVEFASPAPKASVETQEPAAAPDVEQETWARLLSVSVENAKGEPRTIFSSEEEIHLTVEYESMFDKKVYPAFRVYQDNVLIFTVAYWRDDLPTRKGRFRAHAIIPKSLLNPGDFSASIGLNTPITGGLIRHQVAEKVLTFIVHDVSGAVSPRGPYAKIGGAVRPFFDWQVEELKPPTDKCEKAA